jgi:hypothetical protein
MKTREPIVLTVRPMTIGDIDAVADWFDSIDDVSFFDRTAVVPTPIETVRESWKTDFHPAEMPPKALWYIVEDHAGRPAAIGGLRAVNYINGDAVLPAFVAGTCAAAASASASSACSSMRPSPDSKPSKPIGGPAPAGSRRTCSSPPTVGDVEHHLSQE